jgi:uncharacterized coiled-coil protein SlyX
MDIEPIKPYSMYTDLEKKLTVLSGNQEQTIKDLCQQLELQGQHIEQLTDNVNKLSWRNILKELTEPHVKLIIAVLTFVILIVLFAFGLDANSIATVLKAYNCK